MKFGLTLRSVHPSEFADIAAHAEVNGFESVWVPDHVVFPALLPATFPYTADKVAPVAPDTPIYDAWSVLSAVAARTSSIRLGTNVYVLPLRNPLVTARSVVTVDHLSGGRVILGIGIGWLEEEFELLDMPFRDRGPRSDECIEALRLLWTEDTVSYQGRHIRFGPVKFAPKPVQQPSIPIIVGGGSTAALQRAARLGDGWLQPADGKDIDDLKAKVLEITKARETLGRGTLPFEICSRLGTDLDTANRCQEVGVTRCITAGPPGVPTKRDFLDWISLFADSVINRL